MSHLLSRVHHRALRRFFPASIARFARSTRGGATAITATLLGRHAPGRHRAGERPSLGWSDSATCAGAPPMRRASRQCRRMKTLPGDWSDAEVEAHLTALAKRYAHYNVIGNAPVALEEDDITVTVTVKRSEGAVAVYVEAETGGTLLSRYLYGVTGPAEMTAQGGSEVRTKAVEVVLAVDVSYSMSRRVNGDTDQRIAVVKRAAEAMLDTLDIGNGPVAMGIVPWERTVRLDDTLRTAWTSDGYVEFPSSKTYRAPWFGTTNAANALTQTLPDSAPETWKGCLDQRALDSTVDGVPLGISSAVPTSSRPIPQWFYPSEYGIAYACEEITHSHYEFYAVLRLGERDAGLARSPRQPPTRLWRHLPRDDAAQRRREPSPHADPGARPLARRGGADLLRARDLLGDADARLEVAQPGGATRSTRWTPTIAPTSTCTRCWSCSPTARTRSTMPTSTMPPG